MSGEAAFADAIIVAAGSSTRMAGRDKLDELLVGRPLLAWSVAAMAGARSVGRLVIVTRSDRVTSLRSEPWLEQIAAGRVAVIAGGAERSDSVRAGVEATAAGVVLVHDGARPLVSSTLVDAVADAAARHGAAVPVLALADSLKRVEGGMIAASVERRGLVRAQTPQGARRELLLDAFASAGAASFSDEAALLESRGVPVATVPGEPANMKVTEPADLDLIRALVQREPGAAAERIGYGMDSHGFGPQMGLRLGGIVLDGAPRLYGHSDGDVVLHSLATAILSASGLGDLGRVFPASDSSTTGIASGVMLADVVQRAEQAGWAIAWAQLSLVGARPRLGGKRLDEMCDRIAGLIGLTTDAVAVTASTGNLSGPEGAGRVISASALVGLHRR